MHQETLTYQQPATAGVGPRVLSGGAPMARRDKKTLRVNAATLVGVVVTLTLATTLVHAGGQGASSAAGAMMAGLAIEVLVLAHATTWQREISAKA